MTLEKAFADLRKFTVELDELASRADELPLEELEFLVSKLAKILEKTVVVADSLGLEDPSFASVLDRARSRTMN